MDVCFNLEERKKNIDYGAEKIIGTGTSKHVD